MKAKTKRVVLPRSAPKECEDVWNWTKNNGVLHIDDETGIYMFLYNMFRYPLATKDGWTHKVSSMSHQESLEELLKMGYKFE